jgi:hypothetical protein
MFNVTLRGAINYHVRINSWRSEAGSCYVHVQNCCHLDTPLYLTVLYSVKVCYSSGLTQGGLNHCIGKEWN